jgi:diguanylate cyclase (GGDEF)-like protein
MLDIMHPEDREKTLQAVSEIMSGKPKIGIENRYIRKDGEVVHIMWSARWSEKDQLRIAVARDISIRKRNEAIKAALFDISEAAHGGGDLIILFEKIHNIIANLLPAQNFFIALYDSDSDELSFPYYVDQYGEHPTPRPLGTGTLSGEVIRSGKPLLYTPETDARLADSLETVVGKEARYWLGVPLKTQTDTLGALVVQIYDTHERYTDKDLKLLEYVSTQVAAAIERNRMYTRLQHMAQYDALTNLPNRALLNDRLSIAIARAERGQHAFCLIYCDLDNFKQVNDSLGHAAGDLVLREAGLRLNSCVRDSDTVARVGGDEFIILLDSIHSAADAQTVSAKILNAFDPPFYIGTANIRVIPSVGIALYPQNGDNAEALIRYADNAMYLSKRGHGGMTLP